MQNLDMIRRDPEWFAEIMKMRGLEDFNGSELLAIDEKRRSLKTKMQLLLTENKAIANTIAKSKGRASEEGVDPSLVDRSKFISSEIDAMRQELNRYQMLQDKLLYSLPNIIAADVPSGKDDGCNKVVRNSGVPRKFNFSPKPHYELFGSGMDFEGASRISGPRFVVMTGCLAALERALANFMLDLHIDEHGYLEASVPCVVKNSSMFGAGQLPKFDEESFKVDQDFRLIPTAEVPLVSWAIGDKILDSKLLPIRLVACTQCFRSEAGSAGRDVAGLMRLHQFCKVELVSITDNKSSDEELGKLVSDAESILQKLGLAYRVVLLCSGDTGFCSYKTYDLEVWIPSQGRYREISSCSNCLDFQARRLKGRYRESGKIVHLHTLNGSGVAVGRAMIAILENYQNEDGSVTVPDVLRPYVGLDKLVPEA